MMLQIQEEKKKEKKKTETEGEGAVAARSGIAAVVRLYSAAVIFVSH
jgi:hypothetical protein